jgi:hypothetical protein
MTESIWKSDNKLNKAEEIIIEMLLMVAQSIQRTPFSSLNWDSENC